MSRQLIDCVDCKFFKVRPYIDDELCVCTKRNKVILVEGLIHCDEFEALYSCERDSKMNENKENKKPLFFLVCGKSGVGKTTFSKQFSEEMGLIHINSDDYYEKLYGKERGDKFYVWIEIFKDIHKYELEGKGVLLDTNALAEADRMDYVNWFPGFDHHMIWMTADWDTRNKNNHSRNRVIPDDIMQKMNDVEDEPYWKILDMRWKSLLKVITNNNVLEFYDLGGKLPYKVTYLQSGDN